MALVRAKRIIGECAQMFVKNNMQWVGKVFSQEQLTAFREELKKTRLCVFGHSGYLINVASPPGANRDKSIQSLVQELELAESLGLPFLVLHPGAHVGVGEEEGLKRAVSGLDAAIAATQRLKVKIALENTAGQGTCLGHQLEHLALLLEKVRKPSRFCLCIDTAHLFAAGYDIRNAKGWHAVMKTAERLFGTENIAAFHLNDSKTDLGSRVDRHAHIGAGKIGREGFRAILRDKRFAKHPGCIETPKSEDLHEDVENLRILRELASGS